MRRNRGRFLPDFIFQLTAAEVEDLNRSQIVIGSRRHRNPRFRPYAFTEQGVAMLSKCAAQQKSGRGKY
ncbi:MAG: ORF6N domain-containing protein [Acidobacteriota bacterium]